MNVFLGNPPASIKAWINRHRPTPPTAEPLCFTAEEDGSSVSLIGWDKYIPYEQIDIFASLQYSTDNATWQEWDGHVINLAAGEKVYIKALNPNPNGMAYYYEGMGYPSERHQFIFEGKIAASGSIQYLLEDTGSRIDVPVWAYYNLFDDCTSLTQAPALPATQLASNCYDSMFYKCTNLTAAPALPATQLASNCYNHMFYDCTFLTQAPALPATQLASNCYESVFSKCTNLSAAPQLPATQLASNCYNGMFAGCTSLAQAPELPATALADYCYYGMFSKCTNLSAAPALPATALADYCYYGMFYNCTSLTAAPALPATALADYCYYNMFLGCTKFLECHMKASMKGVYDKSTHGDTIKTVIYDL